MSKYIPKVKKISVSLAHGIFGHMGEDWTRTTYNQLEYKITRGSLQPYEAFTTRKAEHKNVTKSRKYLPATKSNKHVFLDISTIKELNNAKKLTFVKNNWRIKVKFFSGMKLSGWYDTNNVMIEPTYERLKK